MKRQLQSIEYTVTAPKVYSPAPGKKAVSVRVTHHKSGTVKVRHFSDKEIVALWQDAKDDLTHYRKETDKWAAKRPLKPQETEKLQRFEQAVAFLDRVRLMFH